MEDGRPAVSAPQPGGAPAKQMEENIRHTIAAFDVELAELQNRTLSMAETVRRQLQAVGEALADNDADRAASAVQGDKAVNALELSLDAYVEFLLSRRQPQASDLRLLIGALRESVDLERAGDEIRSAARGICRWHEHAAAAIERLRPSLVELHARAASMMDEALSVLKTSDASAAYALIGRRADVRSAMEPLIKTVIDEMTAGRIPAADGVEAIRIARAFERVAAHLQNVGEAVVFVVEGVDVRREHLK